MKRIFILTTTIILMIFSMYCLSAQENPAQKKETPVKSPPKFSNISGKVTGCNLQTGVITITTPKGESIVSVIDNNTKITKTRKIIGNIQFKDIKEGDSVAARYETETGANTAQSIDVQETEFWPKK